MDRPSCRDTFLTDAQKKNQFSQGDPQEIGNLLRKTHYLGVVISFTPMCANDGYSLPIEAAIFWEFSDEFCAVEVSPKYKESSACYVPLGPEFREKH